MEPAATETDRLSPRGTAADRYLVELEVAAGFLWWWSLFDVLELGGGAIDPIAGRSIPPAAAAILPRLSRQEALRAGRRAARSMSDPSGAAAIPVWPAASSAVPRLLRSVLLGLVVLIAAIAAGVFLALASSRTPPRTEVLRSAGPLSGIWVRITGPGGAVEYLGHRFVNGGAFSRFTFRREPTKGAFLPPTVRAQKLCASTHVIQPGDAPELQNWRGRTLAVSIYGTKTSAIYCAVLGYGLYLG